MVIFNVVGDFAVLLRAGMSIPTALKFNIVSSVLSFLGMLIGLFLGNIGEASLWIFAITAGTFIYISLVDMVGFVLFYFLANMAVCRRQQLWKFLKL